MRLAALSALLMALALVVGCGTPRVLTVWELPTGYRGWVMVEYSKGDCPPARMTSIRVVYTIDASGHSCTSTPAPQGVRFERFYEVDSGRRKRELQRGHWGKGGEIWAETQAQQENIALFFVGTEAELQKSWEVRPKWWQKPKPENNNSR